MSMSQVDTSGEAPRMQLRGNCQCCGREQAVVRGTMSKHGYEVKDGWFQGVCTGQNHPPLQRERDHADSIVQSVLEDCRELRAKAQALREGRIQPKLAKSGNKLPAAAGAPYWKREDEMVPFQDAPPSFQKEAVDSAAWSAQRRAEIGESFAQMLAKAADLHHGQPLRQVPLEAPAAPIQAGEQRRAPRGLLTARYQDGAMVHWVDARGFRGKTASRSWRALPQVVQHVQTASQESPGHPAEPDDEPAPDQERCGG